MVRRRRFPLEVISALCSVFGSGRVGVRMSPFSTYQGMREKDPMAVFLPYVQQILEQHPGLAYIHALEPRAMDTVDIDPEHIVSTDTLGPIRDLCRKKRVAFITAGGWHPDTALRHAEDHSDLIAFGRHFIGKNSRIRTDISLKLISSMQRTQILLHESSKVSH